MCHLKVSRIVYGKTDKKMPPSPNDHFLDPLPFLAEHLMAQLLVRENYVEWGRLG